MARDLSAYREVAVQSVRDPHTGVAAIRPMPGQGFAPVLRVHGAGRLLREHPLGTCFLVRAKMSDRLGGEPFLYVYHGDEAQVLPAAEARRFLGQYRRLRL
ncbi:MAG: hypothetical protein ACXU8N_10485 [Telluria sp.]